MLTLIQLFHCLHDSVWAAPNWAEIPEHLGFGQHCGTYHAKHRTLLALVFPLFLYACSLGSSRGQSLDLSIDVQGGSSGRPSQFVDIKFKVTAQYTL